MQNVGAPKEILSHIVAVQKFFRDHHKSMAYLSAKDGRPSLKPQLPNETRWTSHDACLQTFVHNHSFYVEIRDELGDEKVNGVPVFPQHIIRFIDNRLLLVEARHLLETFKTLKAALDVFQSDSATLGDATYQWIRLSSDEELHEDLKNEINRRFRQVF